MIAVVLAAQLASAQLGRQLAVTVDIAHAANRLVPLRSIGAGLDAENPGADAVIYAPQDVSAMLGSGLGAITYRLYTELAVQAWHWNPNGTWSSPQGGYWTGSTAIGPKIENSYGYRLPGRGNTLDQANNDNYSRLDDGNPQTYWKSNPYLAQRFTGDPDASHPQWVFFRFKGLRKVNAIRIAWSNPYAISYAVQYWTGADPLYAPAAGRWKNFPNGVVTNGAGGTVTLELANAPMRVQFVRVAMTASSNTCDSHGSGDPRNCVGYAIDEIGIGTLGPSGAFTDIVVHAPNHTQTVTYASSVDPWHDASDRDTYDEVQPGLDAVFQSGVTRGLPAMVPVALLYGTPQDAAAEIAYLRARGDAIRGVELGEEPDGQYVSPEDDAALYVQWARAIHAVAPGIPLGGPVFQGSRSDILAWRNAAGDASWLRRFLLYLRSHDALDQLAFMSFEHYPFNPCDPQPWADLRKEPSLASGILGVWRADGLPSGVPMYVTEANFSAYAGAVFQQLVGGLWFADTVGSFVSSGAGGVYLYQYAPEPIVHFDLSCQTFGEYGIFAGTDGFRVRQPTSQYFAAQMLMNQWAQPVDAFHTIFTTRTQPAIADGPVTSYALRRPDGQYAVLLINKDPAQSATVTLRFTGSGGATYAFGGTVTRATLGSAQYVWHGNSRTAYAAPDGPIAVAQAPASATYALAPGSMMVLRGRLTALAR